MKGRTTMAAKGTDNESNKKANAHTKTVRASKAKTSKSSKKKSDAAVKDKTVSTKGNKGKVKISDVAPYIEEPRKSKRLLEWEEPEKLILVEGWARDGLSEKQIAHNMGCAYSTFKLWKNTSSALLAALKKGKEVSDYLVENALFTSALSGNVVAQIFWLKNRKPENWQDRVEKKVEIDTEDAGGVLMIAPRLEGAEDG